MAILSNFRPKWRFFDDSPLFKGLKSHDAGTGGTKVWYQNVRQAKGYNPMSKVRLRELEAKPKGPVLQKIAPLKRHLVTKNRKFWNFNFFSIHIINIFDFKPFNIVPRLFLKKTHFRHCQAYSCLIITVMEEQIVLYNNLRTFRGMKDFRLKYRLKIQKNGTVRSTSNHCKMNRCFDSIFSCL